MKLLARFGLAIVVVAATYFAMLRIAEHKADVLAGDDTFRLDPAHPAQMRSFDELIDQLRLWKQADLAESLTALREKGELWIAPHLGGNRSAICVSALGLAKRIYVRDDVLIARELPFPHLNVPDDGQRLFARIRLAGTLFHELQHYNGLEDEKTTYDREVEWYRRLRQDTLAGLEGEAARSFEWAVDSAIESALAARQKATDAGLDQSTSPARSAAAASTRKIVALGRGHAARVPRGKRAMAPTPLGWSIFWRLRSGAFMHKSVWIVGTLFCLAAAAPRAEAQQAPADAGPSCHEQGPLGYIPREVLLKPITLRTNIGRVEDPVSTKNPEAQAFYNQGEAYLHSYVWIDAGRSFNQALRLDPGLAMAHVGLFRTLANLDDLADAEAELQKAQASQSTVSDRERRRIELTAKQLEALKDLHDVGKHVAYKNAIETALNANPEDVELWLLRGNAEEIGADGRGQRGGAGSIAFYESALARSKDNFAAHHYLIHSYEVIGHNQEAEKHGERYASLASGIPHAHHMWGHDLRLVGKIDAAIEQFGIANELEKTWYRTDGIDPSLDWHRPHNLDLLSRSLQHEGRMHEAEQHIREAMDLTPKTLYGGFRRKMLTDFLIARGRNDEALTSAHEMIQSEWPLARLEGHVLAGRTLLAMNKVSEARIELDAAESEGPEAAKSVTGPFSYHRMVDNQLGELRGEVLLRTNEEERAGTLLREAAASLASHRGADALEELYLLEHIARIARERKQWDLAQYTSGLMTAFDPSYFGAHYAGSLLAEHNGDAAKAREELAAAKALWRRADPGLTELSAIDSKLLVAAK